VRQCDGRAEHNKAPAESARNYRPNPIGQALVSFDQLFSSHGAKHWHKGRPAKSSLKAANSNHKVVAINSEK